MSDSRGWVYADIKSLSFNFDAKRGEIHSALIDVEVIESQTSLLVEGVKIEVDIGDFEVPHIEIHPNIISLYLNSGKSDGNWLVDHISRELKNESDLQLHIAIGDLLSESKAGGASYIVTDWSLQAEVKKRA